MKTLSTALVATLACVDPACGQTLGWWKFDDAPPGTVASGNVAIRDFALGNDAAALGGPVFVAAPSVCFTQGVSLSGLGQFLSVPDRSEYAALRSFTVEAVFSTTGYRENCCGFNQIVFRGDDRGSLDPFFLALTSSGQVGLFVDNVLIVQTTEPVPINVPVHIAASLDDLSGAALLYVDRVLNAASTTALRPTDVLIGPRPGLGFGNIQSDFLDQYLSGAIYEVRLSAAALAPAQLLPGLGVRLTDTTLGLICRAGTATVHATLSPAADADPTSARWEIADPDAPGGWRPIVPGVNTLPPPALPGTFVAGGTASTTLSISSVYASGAFPPTPQPFQFRCVAANACGTAQSAPITLTACKVDINCAGGVTVQDIFDFLTPWFAGAPAADFNDQGGVSVQDIFDFLAAYFAGCP